MKQLRQFIQVAQDLSFSRAAQRLCISQPPLSVSIRKLEESLGVQLFVRERPKLRLTAAGEHFLKQAKQIVAQYDSAVEATRNIGKEFQGSLRIAFLPSAAFNFMPRIIKRFKETHPRVQIIPTPNSSEHIISAVRRGEVDVGLAVTFHSDDPELTFVSAGFEKIMLAVPANHRFADRKKISIPQLKGDVFISFPRRKNFGFGNYIMTMCRHYGFYPEVVMESAQMQTILALVASGIGVAFVPATSMSFRVDGIRYIEISDPKDILNYELSFVYSRANANDVIRAFIHEARRYSPSIEPYEIPTVAAAAG